LKNSYTPSNRTLSPKHEEDDDDTVTLPRVRVIIPESSDISTDEDRQPSVSHSGGVSPNANGFLAPTATFKEATQSPGNASSVTKIESLELEVKGLKEELARLRRDRGHLDSQMHTMNLSLEAALRECQQRCAEYSDNVKRLKYTLSEKNPAERRLLYQQEKQIETLRSSLRERKQNAVFSRLSAGEHYIPKQDDIQKAINNIHHETKKILFSYEDNFTTRTPDLDHEDDLRCLLRRTLGINSSSPIRSEMLKKVLERNGLQAAICALTTAALCEWVFAADFESTIAQTSMLLNMYRQHISRMGKFWL
jgi:hypothetical protein